MRCCSAGADEGEELVMECMNADELSVRERAGWVWKEDRALGATMWVGTLGNISDLSGKECEASDSARVMSRSKMGGRISGDGGDGDWPGDRGHDTPDLCAKRLIRRRGAPCGRAT